MADIEKVRELLLIACNMRIANDGRIIPGLNCYCPLGIYFQQQGKATSYLGFGMEKHAAELLDMNPQEVEDFMVGFDNEISFGPRTKFQSLGYEFRQRYLFGR